MAYERVNWENGSSGGTPLSAENLNRMDLGIANASQKADICTTINIGGTNYPLVSIRQATISGVQGWLYTLDNGTTDGLTVFFADQTGLSTVKAAIEAQIPTVDSTLSSTSTNPVQNKMITNALANKQEVTDAVTVSAVSTTGVRISDGSSGMQYVVPLTSAIKSTITASDTNPVNSVAVASYAQPLTDKVSVSGTSVTQALDADKMYIFGEVTALTVTLNASSDSSHVHEYHFRFTSGSTATTLTLPSNVTMPSDFTVEASKTYEISIVDNYGAYVAW